MESDVRTIEEYMEGRLDESSNGSGRFPVVFDIGALGWPSQEKPPAPRDGKIKVSIRLAAEALVVGLLDEDQGPCSRCLERRWFELRFDDQQEFLAKWWEANPTSAPYQPRLSSFSLDALWLLVENIANLNRGGNQNGVQPESSAGGAELFVLDLETHGVARYGLLPDTACPVCAMIPPARPEQDGWPLSSSPKPNPDARRLRTVSEISLSEDHLTNPLCGALGPRASRDYMNPVTAPVVGQFWALSANNRFRLHWGGHANSYRDSLTIGLIEGLERRAGVIPSHKGPEIFDSYRNLKQDALDPRGTGEYEANLFSKQLAYWVPFNEDLKMYWVWGYSLTERRHILVPEQLVYYCNHSYRQPLFVHECSNGCASGTSFEEALLYALLELIERDHFLITWFARLGLPRIDHTSVRSSEFQFMCDRIERLGYDISIFDMRLDMPIPVVLAIATQHDGGMGALSLAAGAGLDPLSGIWGAVCEIATYIGSMADRVGRREEELREMAADFTKVLGLEDHMLLWGLPEMLPHAQFLWDNPGIGSADDVYAGWEKERPRNLDQTDDIKYCIDILVERGLEQVIVVDQTTREQKAVGLHTACAIVPGLVPIDFGYEKRRYLSLPRTYTVPRIAGLRDRDLVAADLNPMPHPFP